MKLTVAFLVALIPLATASPLAELDARATQFCGQNEAIHAGPYTLSLNRNARQASACAQVDSQNGNNVAWSSTWTSNKQTGTDVKSFTNVAANDGLGKQLSAIRSIKSSWEWSQIASSPLVANVVYQLITSSTAKGSDANEIKIWLVNFNADQSIPSNHRAGRKPVPWVSGVSLAGHTWDIYSGQEAGKNVFSFLSSDRASIHTFSADLKVFLDFLVSNQSFTQFSRTQYLIALKAGTEATSGSARFRTSSYSAVIN